MRSLVIDLSVGFVWAAIISLIILSSNVLYDGIEFVYANF